MYYFKEEEKKNNKNDDCPMCSIDEEMIEKLKKEAEKEQSDNKKK